MVKFANPSPIKSCMAPSNNFTQIPSLRDWKLGLVRRETIISLQESIPAGCVQPACWPYPVVSHAQPPPPSADLLLADLGGGVCPTSLSRLLDVNPSGGRLLTPKGRPHVHWMQTSPGGRPPVNWMTLPSPKLCLRAVIKQWFLSLRR